MARDSNGRWLPGTTGNPNGSSRTAKELSAKIRAGTDDLIDYLFSLAEKGHPIVRLKAIEILLDRGFGKPQGGQGSEELRNQPIQINIISQEKPERLRLIDASGSTVGESADELQPPIAVVGN